MIDNEGVIFFWWSHGLITREEYENVLELCQLSSEGPLKIPYSDTKACDETLNHLLSRLRGLNVSLFPDLFLGCVAEIRLLIYHQITRSKLALQYLC